jgi:hypothetical protein
MPVRSARLTAVVLAPGRGVRPELASKSTSIPRAHKEAP